MRINLSSREVRNAVELFATASLPQRRTWIEAKQLDPLLAHRRVVETANELADELEDPAYVDRRAIHRARTLLASGLDFLEVLEASPATPTMLRARGATLAFMETLVAALGPLSAADSGLTGVHV